MVYQSIQQTVTVAGISRMTFRFTQNVLTKKKIASTILISVTLETLNHKSLNILNKINPTCLPDLLTVR